MSARSVKWWWVKSVWVNIWGIQLNRNMTGVFNCVISLLHTHTHTHARTHTPLLTSLYGFSLFTEHYYTAGLYCGSFLMRARTHTRTHINTQTNTHTHTHTQIHRREYTHLCLQVCMDLVCLQSIIIQLDYIALALWYTHTYYTYRRIHTHTHTHMEVNISFICLSKGLWS